MPMPPLVASDSWHCLGTGIAASAAVTPVSATWPAANRALYIPILVTEDITVTKLWCHNGSAVSGNVNMCLYNSAFAQVAGTEIGSTAQAGTSVLQEFNIADTAIVAGLYYIGIVLSNTTGEMVRYTTPPTNVALQSWGMAQELLASVDLPATATPADVATPYLPRCGIATRTQVA